MKKELLTPDEATEVINQMGAVRAAMPASGDYEQVFQIVYDYLYEHTTMDLRTILNRIYRAQEEILFGK